MPTKTAKTKIAAKPMESKKSTKPAAAKSVKKPFKSKPKMLPKTPVELVLPAASAAMQLPSPKPGRAGKKKYPIIGIALIFCLLCLGIILFCLWLANSALSDFTVEKLKEVIVHEEPAFAVPKVNNDQQLVAGDYWLPRNAWSPDSSKFVVSQVDEYMEYGLPEKVSTYVYDPAGNKLSNLTEQAEGNEVTPAVIWKDSNSVAVAGRMFDLTDLNNITSEAVPAEDLDGFELLKSFTAIDPATKKAASTILAREFSPDGMYLAVVSESAGPVLTVIPRGAASADAAINLGRVKMTAESNYLLNWSRNGRYLFVNDDEVVDMHSNTVLLPPLGDYDYRGTNRKIFPSADELWLLVIDYASAGSDENAKKIRIFVKDLVSGAEADIVRPAAYDAASALIPYRESGGFTPDGKYVLFYYDGQLWLADAVTGKKRPVTETGSDYYDFHLSPDGTKLLYLIPGKEVRMATLQW